MLRKRKSWWRQVSTVLLETTMSLRRTNRGTDACILFFVQGRHPSVFLHLPAVPLQHQHKQVLWWAGPARSIHSSQHHSDHPYGCGGLGVPCHLHLCSQCTWPCWLVCLCAVQSFTSDIQAMPLTLLRHCLPAGRQPGPVGRKRHVAAVFTHMRCWSALTPQAALCMMLLHIRHVCCFRSKHLMQRMGCGYHRNASKQF